MRKKRKGNPSKWRHEHEKEIERRKREIEKKINKRTK